MNPTTTTKKKSITKEAAAIRDPKLYNRFYELRKLYDARTSFEKLGKEFDLTPSGAEAVVYRERRKIRAAAGIE